MGKAVGGTVGERVRGCRGQSALAYFAFSALASRHPWFEPVPSGSHRTSTCCRGLPGTPAHHCWHSAPGLQGVGGGTSDLSTLRLAGVAGMVGGALSMAVRSGVWVLGAGGCPGWLDADERVHCIMWLLRLLLLVGNALMQHAILSTTPTAPHPTHVPTYLTYPQFRWASTSV